MVLLISGFCVACFVVGAVLGRLRRKVIFGGLITIVGLTGAGLVGAATFADLPMDQAGVYLIVGWLLCAALMIASIGYTLFQPIDKYGW